MCPQFREYCENITCVNTLSGVDIKITLKRPLDIIYTRLVMHYNFGGTFKQFMINVENDFCAYMAGGSDPVLDMFMFNLRPVSNINHSCPYSGDIFVDKYVYDKTFLDNKVIPNGQYRLDLTLFTAKKKIFYFMQTFVTVPQYVSPMTALLKG